MINILKKIFRINLKKKQKNDQQKNKNVIIKKYDIDEDIYHFRLNSYSEVVYITDTLLQKGKVVIDVEDLKQTTRKRVIDFLSGVIFTKKGKIEKISNFKYFLIIKEDK